MAKATRKSSDHQSDKATKPPRRLMNLSLNDEAYKRLSHHAIETGTTVSALVTSFAMTLPSYSAKNSE